jgi:hypothetical protein
MNRPALMMQPTICLNPEPEPRYTSVATKFLMLTTAQKDTLATVDIGDTISVEKTFASGTGTTQLAQELSVEGIEHYLDFRTGHRVLVLDCADHDRVRINTWTMRYMAYLMR